MCKKHDNALWRNGICVGFHDKKRVLGGNAECCIFALQTKTKKREVMKKLLNFHTDGSGTGTLLLYGDIGEYGQVKSERIVSELMEAEAACSRINVRVNSNGGEVFSGIAIFNALRQSKAEIHIYVDGIAASMASVIALCGRRVEMSRYARLMIHCVSGGCWGTKKDMQKCIDEMDSLEDSLCEMYAGKTGMTKEEVKSAYFDGEDHWLTADEALRLGFVDGIYDAEEVPAGSTTEEIYNIFNNRLVEPQNVLKMNLEEIMKKAPFADCKDEADFMARVDRMAAEVENAASLRAENEALKKRVDEFEAAAEAVREASRKALLDAAEADGRINAETRPLYESILKSNPDEGEKALEALAPRRKVMDDLRVVPGDESPWSRRMKEINDKLNK